MLEEKLTLMTKSSHIWFQRSLEIRKDCNLLSVRIRGINAPTHEMKQGTNAIKY